MHASSIFGPVLAVVLLEGAVMAPGVQAVSEEYLFTVQADSGTAVAKKAVAGERERFRLTLRGVDPVTKFADRPFRDAKVISPAALASNWDAWFASSPPNAVLTFSTPQDPSGSIVVTLTNPQYDAANRTLTFTAVRDPRQHDPAEKGPNWERRTTPKTFGAPALFIDGAGGTGGNGGNGGTGGLYGTGGNGGNGGSA